jgi:hypothetical protein
MNTLVAGAALALVVAGYPLYELVTSGDLDATSAVIRGAVVVAACAAGITAIVRLALGYEEQGQHQRHSKLNALFSDMEDAMATGTLSDEAAADGGSGEPGAATPSPAD